MKFVLKQLYKILAIAIIFLSNFSLCNIKNKKIERSFNLYPEKTRETDWGEGSIFYLDRHNVDAGPKRVICGFNLYMPKKGKIAYQFCTSQAYKGRYYQHQNISTQTYDKYTAWGDTASDETQSAHFLDRHEVKCDGDDLIQQFQLQRKGNQIRYRYRCVKTSIKKCHNDKTDFNSKNSSLQIINLQKLHISLPLGHGLNSFKLHVKHKNNKTLFRYDYKHCSL